MAGEHDFEPIVLQAVEARNAKQKDRLFEKLDTHFQHDLAGKTIAVWGLAFKPDTDDMREAPSVRLINSLMKAGANVRAYDPAASETARREFDPTFFTQGRLTFCEAQYEAAIDADALVLVTEWKLFRHPDLKTLRKLLKAPVIVDGRNQYDPHQLVKTGFVYYGIGRSARAT
jgi:UDPglucose 6-dehydrogenase